MVNGPRVFIFFQVWPFGHGPNSTCALPRFELSGFELMRPQLSEDLWLTSKMPYDYSIDSSRAQQSGFFLAGTGILKGFVDTGSGQARCGEYCCGLPILREHNTSTGASGFICLLRNLSDLPVAWLQENVASHAMPCLDLISL